MSDLHLEFSSGNMTLPELSTDKDSVLILAGDIGIGKRQLTYINFFKDIAPRFKLVIYILGNHEFYCGSFLRILNKIQKNILAVPELKNVCVVDNETIVCENVSFICSTLWTNFRNGNPIVMNDAQYLMNDYKRIRTGSSQNARYAYARKLNTIDVLQYNCKASRYIFSEIEKQKKIGKVVVVTHHAPSFQSIPERYKTDIINNAFVSDYDNKIIESKPDFWIHGHIHDNFDYMIENTRILCNPRGYYSSELNLEFDPCLTVEI